MVLSIEKDEEHDTYELHQGGGRGVLTTSDDIEELKDRAEDFAEEGESLLFEDDDGVQETIF